MDKVYFNKSLTEAQALTASQTNTSTVYFTADTKRIVLGGVLYSDDSLANGSGIVRIVNKAVKLYNTQGAEVTTIVTTADPSQAWDYGDDTTLASVGRVKAEMEKRQDKVAIQSVLSGVSSQTLATGKLYRFEGEVGTLSLTLPSVADTSVLQSVGLIFTTGSAPAVTISSNGNIPIAYYDGYSIEADTTYEFNIMFNGQKWIVAYGIIE